MRSVRSATWTSVAPVSLSPLPYVLTIFALDSLVSIALLPRSCLAVATPRARPAAWSRWIRQGSLARVLHMHAAAGPRTGRAQSLSELRTNGGSYTTSRGSCGTNGGSYGTNEGSYGTNEGSSATNGGSSGTN